MGRGAVQARANLIAVVLISIVGSTAFFNALHVASNLIQTSDSAQGFVVGHEIVGGNVFLSGWHFPVDNFYFTDSLPYAAIEGIAGSRPYLMVVVPAIIYAILVVLALVLCVRPAQPFSENLQPVAATVLLLGLPVWVGAWNPMLMSDMHTATAATALAALALCARVATDGFRKSGGLFYAAVTSLLAVFAVASDPFSLVFAFGPAAAVLMIEAFRSKGLPNARAALLMLVAAMAAGLLLPWIIARTGGFTTENDVAFGFAPVGQWWKNLIDVVFGILTLWGADPTHVQSASDGVILAIRCAGLAFVVFAVIYFLRDILRAGQVTLLDRLLCAGAAVSLAACLPSAQFAKGVHPQTMWHGGPPMRFLVPAVLFAAVLACRQVNGVLASLPNITLRLAFRSAFMVIAGLAFLMSILQPFSASARPSWIEQNPAGVVARWLQQHGLSQGAGEYWSANLVTAISGNAIRVRSMVPDDGRLIPYVWVGSRAFYAAPPQFAIWHEPNQSGVTAAIVRATWPVCAIRTLAGYRIALVQTFRKPARCPFA
jgi:hypothetical protein